MTKRDEFIAAVKSQNIAEVIRLLEIGVSPNLIVDVPERLKAIDYAKRIRNDGLLSALVAYGARNDEKIAISSSSSSSSMEASQGNTRAQFVSAVRAINHGELTRLLDSYPSINPNTMMDTNKNTALHYACKQGDIMTVGLLMQHPKTLIKIKNKQGLTPVDIAVRSQNIDILRHLSAHADFKVMINSLFNQAWENDDRPTILFLSQQLDCIEFSKISIALRHGDFETFQRLLFEGHSLSSAEIFQVVESNDERFINLAMSSSIDFEVRAPGASENILVLLAKKDKWPAVLTFVNSHPLAGLDIYGYTELLLLALESKNEAAIEALLAAKTPLNCLYGQQGQILLNALRDSDAQKIISLLLNEAVNDENMVKYLKFNTSSIPPHLQSYFIDPIMSSPFSKPVITVHGFTYESEGILQWIATNPNDPFTREPVLAQDLLPNTDVILLMEYYLLNGDNITEGFPLINPGTNFFYIDPVVAEDGRTYEREVLKKYLRVHNNFLPLHNPGDESKKQDPDRLRSNRLFKTIIEEQYLKKEFLHYLKTRQYDQLREMLVKGFAINTTLDDAENQLSHFAILDDDLALLSLCFEFGADFQRRNKKGETAIQLAGQSNNPAFYTRILENLSTHKPADFIFFFKEQLQSNNLPMVKYLLQNYRACCRPAIRAVLGENNVTLAALELILENEDDTRILDEVDAMLPKAIESGNISLLNVLLKTKAPMRSLLTIMGTKVLQNMVIDRAANVQLIKIVRDAVDSRHFAVAFHVKQILEPEALQEEKMLPIELDDLVTDPIDSYPFNNPQITPTGQSFSAHSIVDLAENPISRAPLTHEQLRPNLLLGDLVKFLQCASTNVNMVPPMLLSLFTLTLMTKPMVAENGITYDEAELPQDMRESSYPDVSIQALCSYYRAKQEKSGKVGFFGNSGGLGHSTNDATLTFSESHQMSQ